MNEVFAPIYYTFKTDSADLDDREHAEADAFFCFVELLSKSQIQKAGIIRCCVIGLLSLARR